MGFDRNEWQKAYRKDNGNSHTKAYERTKSGKLMRTYRNMESRVSGILKTKEHLYGGLDLLPRQEFYDWSLKDFEFNRLFSQWVESGYEMRLSPSVDRVDPEKGYVLSNMRWVTHSENSRLGAVGRGKNE